MASHDWRMAGENTPSGGNPYHRVPTRSGVRPDEAGLERYSHGGNLHRHAVHTTDGRFNADDAPFIPRDHHPAQFVNPAAIFHVDAPPVQHFGGGRQYYRQDVGDQNVHGQAYGRTNASIVPPSIHLGGHDHHSPHTHGNTAPAMPTALPPAAFHQSSRRDEAGEDLRRILNLGPHEPVNLWSIPDTGARPTVSGHLLCKLAIYGSPNKQLTLQEIYAELIHRFKWFNTHRNEPAWKNSIRHLLSLYHPFENVPRPVTEPGKGNYWWLDYSKGADGYKRERKRRPRGRSNREREEVEVEEYDIFDGDPGDLTESEGRGSPDARSGNGGSSKPHISRVQSMPMIVDEPVHCGMGQYGVDSTTLRGTHPAHAHAYRHALTPGPSSYHHQSDNYHSLAGPGPSSHAHMISTSSSFRPQNSDVKLTLEELQAREGRQLRPRPSQPNGRRAISPTDQAYAKSRRYARPG